MSTHDHAASAGAIDAAATNLAAQLSDLDRLIREPLTATEPTAAEALDCRQPIKHASETLRDAEREIDRVRHRLTLLELRHIGAQWRAKHPEEAA